MGQAMSDPMKEALDAVGRALDHAEKVRRETGRPRCGCRVTVQYQTGWAGWSCTRPADHAGAHAVPDGMDIDGRVVSVEWEQG